MAGLLVVFGRRCTAVAHRAVASVPLCRRPPSPDVEAGEPPGAAPAGGLPPAVETTIEGDLPLARTTSGAPQAVALAAAAAPAAATVVGVDLLPALPLVEAARRREAAPASATTTSGAQAEAARRPGVCGRAGPRATAPAGHVAGPMDAQSSVTTDGVASARPATRCRSPKDALAPGVASPVGPPVPAALRRRRARAGWPTRHRAVPRRRSGRPASVHPSGSASSGPTRCAMRRTVRYVGARRPSARRPRHDHGAERRTRAD